MKDIKVYGIDLAKNIFQLHGADAKGKKVLQKRLKRGDLLEFMANQKPCLIGLEACGSAHYWAREFQSLGHEVKLMAPQFVKPYVKSNKNDRNDACAIAEAVTRPEMRFVPIKRIDQQDTLLLHRTRELLIKSRTAQANQIRGLLGEYGIVIPKGLGQLKKLPEILELNQKKLTLQSERIFNRQYEYLKSVEKEIAFYDKALEKAAEENAQCREIMKIEGIGPITASAVVATVGDAKVFKNGREMSAWLGVVPRQHSSGNKIRLGGISKRGDRYVRSLLIHGGRSVTKVCQTKTDKRHLWLASKKERSGFNKAAVALANKNARIIWAILSSGECYNKAA